MSAPMTNQDEEWIAEKAWTIANDLFAEILMGARAEMMARDDIVFMTYIKLGMIGYVQVALREALARGERRERERERERESSSWKVYWDASSEYLRLGYEQRTYGWHDLMDAHKKGLDAVGWKPNK